MSEMARNALATLPALGFMALTLGIVMLATLMWVTALIALLALVGLRMPLRSRQARMIRMARQMRKARP